MTILVAVLVAVGLVALAVVVVPRLVRRGDERRAGPSTGLGDVVAGGRETTVTTDDGADLHVVEWGQGTPIVFVHGLGLDHRSFHYQYIDLADRHRLVGIDLRGHGRSTLGSEPIGPHRFAADVAAVFEQLDLRHAVLLGHSLGGTVVGQLCADRPDLIDERVAGLAFVGSFASAIAGEGRFRERCSPTMIRMAARFQTGSEPRGKASSSALSYAMARSPFGPHPQPEQVRFTLDLGSACAPAVMSGATVANIDYDVRTALGQVGCPALIARGEHDRLSTERSTAQLKAALPDAEVVVFDGCGHLPLLEDRALFSDVLAGFVGAGHQPPLTSDERIRMASINETIDPTTPAVIVVESGDTVTFGELETRSRRLAHLFRARGLVAGSHVAILLDNDLHYFEVCWAAQRSGIYLTPINWQLGADEAGYILTDCGATALLTSSRFADLMAELGPRLDGVSTRLSVDGPFDTFEDYGAAVAEQPTEPLADETEGALMFYSSGTTGRPKGILPPLAGTPFGTGGVVDMLVGMYGIGAGTRYLVPAPLYHAAPIGWSMGAQRAGSTVVLLGRFDAEVALRAIEEHRVTHAQFVPTHFVRMLKLDREARTSHSTSSLQVVIHAAAPCPVEVKRQMLDWWGPIIHEYYSGSEGVGFCAVSPEEWLERPGTVGKALMGTPHIVAEDGTELAVGEIGQIWFEGALAFEYHGDPEKTASVFDHHGWATLGDVGYLDDDGYLYLTDRVSHMIISGGVNIYPQEIEDALVLHPRVADAAVIGIPDADMGESVLGVIQPADPNDDEDDLAAELDRFCRSQLAGFKCPRSYRFTDQLPRLPTGKLLKRKLRDQFGGSSAGSVVSDGSLRPE